LKEKPRVFLPKICKNFPPFLSTKNPRHNFRKHRFRNVMSSGLYFTKSATSRSAILKYPQTKVRNVFLLEAEEHFF